MNDDFITRISSILGSAYVVERELGAGMSRVVVARDVALGRRVVVKVLPADWAAGLSADRFRREVVLAAALQHPHIVPLLSASEAADGTLYYTMPFVDGESLRSRLEKGSPPLPLSVRWLRDVASALAYAHSRGIVHRDMKPDNILLSGEYAVVADFGIAKALTSASATLTGMTAASGPITTVGTTLGTPTYMAPEQVAAESDTDYRADLYALGVIAYEVLTGEPPFKGTSQAILVAHLTAEAQPVDVRRKGLPDALGALVQRCLAKNAADRPQTADEIVIVLEGVLRTISSDSADLAPPFAPIKSRADANVGARSPSARYKRLMVMGGVLAITAAIIAFWNASREPAIVANRVAVATLRDATPDSSLREIARSIAGDITSELTALDGSDVVGRDEVERAERAFSREQLIPQVLGKALHAQFIVVGELSAVGADSVRVRVSLVSGADGKTIRGLSDVHALRTEIRSATGNLRSRLAGAMVLVSGADFVAGMLPVGDPPLLAAVASVREGLRLEASLITATPGEDESYAEMFRFDKAIRTDPKFVQALLWFVSAALRRPGGEVYADSVLTLLQVGQVQLSEYERALMDALRADAIGNHELSVRSWRRAAGIAPAWPNRWWLAMKLRDANRPSEALAILDSLAVSNAHFKRTVPGLRHYVADFKGEYQAMREEGQRAPSTVQSLGFQQAMLQSLAALDSVVAVTRQLDAASQLPAEPGSSVAYLLTRTSWELAAHGHAKESEAALKRAVSWCQRRTAVDLANDDVAFDCMEAYAYSGQLAPLAALAAPSLRARGSDADVAVLGVLGLAAALRGDSLGAEQFAARVEGATRADGSHGLASWNRARIAAGVNNKKRAIELLEDAFARGAGWSQRLDLHRDPAFSSLRGVADFERLRQPQG